MKGFISRNKVAITIVLFCLLYQFFNCYYVINSIPKYTTIFSTGIAIIVFIHIFKAIFYHNYADGLSRAVKMLLVMFLLSPVWAYIYWGQGMVRSIYAIFCPYASSVMLLMFYFVFKKYELTMKQSMCIILIMSAIYSICHLIGLLTVPNSIFGFNVLSEDIETSLTRTMEARGVFRLAMPGADWVVFAIFALLTKFRNNKKYYILLVPLFVMLVLRGTRTPFFVTILVCLLYLVYIIKNKWLMAIGGLITILALIVTYDTLLEMKSDNPVVLYVQMTQEQVSSNHETEDVRVEMTKYMFNEFNGNNVLAYITGNGVPSGVNLYANTMSRLSLDKGFFVVDVAFAEIFIYFGIVGLVLYFLLIWRVYKTKITDDCMYAKLFILYLVLIMPTNCAIVTTPFMFALALYIVSASNKQLSYKTKSAL